MAEKFIEHRHAEGDEVIQIRIFKFEPSQNQPEGYSYSLVYVKNGKRLVGYDNFEGHTKGSNNHHKHINEKVIEYIFVDIWRLIEDFNQDVERVKR